MTKEDRLINALTEIAKNANQLFDAISEQKPTDELLTLSDKLNDKLFKAITKYYTKNPARFTVYSLDLSESDIKKIFQKYKVTDYQFDYKVINEYMGTTEGYLAIHFNCSRYKADKIFAEFEHNPNIFTDDDDSYIDIPF